MAVAGPGVFFSNDLRDQKQQRLKDHPSGNKQTDQKSQLGRRRVMYGIIRGKGTVLNVVSDQRWMIALLL